MDDKPFYQVKYFYTFYNIILWLTYPSEHEGVTNNWQVIIYPYFSLSLQIMQGQLLIAKRLTGFNLPY